MKFLDSFPKSFFPIEIFPEFSTVPGQVLFFGDLSNGQRYASYILDSDKLLSISKGPATYYGEITTIENSLVMEIGKICSLIVQGNPNVNIFIIFYIFIFILFF